MKILIVGQAKTGTTILLSKLKNTFPNHKTVFELGGDVEGIQNIILHKNKTIKGNVIVKTIFTSIQENNLNEISKYYDKCIFIIRDPRDRLISRYLYSWFKDHKPKRLLFNKAFWLVQKKEKNKNKISLNSIIENIYSFYEKERKSYNSIIDFLKNKNDKWFLLKYEDLVDNK
jgi:hypothetical protein